MPRYEFQEGTSNKFWEITLDGSSFTTKYGKIGTDGQETVKEWGGPEQAKKEYDKLIAEKTKKGYKLVSGAGAAAAPKKPIFEDEGDDEDQDHVATTPMRMPAPKAAAGRAPASDGRSEQGMPAPKAAATRPASDGGKRRHFELVEGTSSKFWEISMDGTSFTTRYGRIGTSGQETVKDFGTVDKAQKEYEKLVAEKVKKGYLEK